MARFLLDDKIQNCVLGDENEFYAGLPLSNVKELSKSLIARSKSTSSVTISGEFAKPENISCFILGGHNLSYGSSYFVKGYDEFSVEKFRKDGIIGENDAAILDLYTTMSKPIWLSEEYRILTFELDISSTTGTNIELYRLMAGAYIETNVGISYNNNLSWAINNKSFRTEAGSLRSEVTAPNKVLEFSMDTVSESERPLLQRSLSFVGKRKEFFVSAFECPVNSIYPDTPKTVDYSGIVKLKQIPKFTEFAQNFYKSKYVVEEV